MPQRRCCRLAGRLVIWVIVALSLVQRSEAVVSGTVPSRLRTVAHTELP